jgi:hypothetical protein
MVVRNEALRLPFMLQHYFERGVDRIFVFDNDSTDDTQSIGCRLTMLTFFIPKIFLRTRNHG